MVAVAVLRDGGRMRRTRDAKVDLLAASSLCRGWSTTEVGLLARLADLVDLPAGTVLHTGSRCAGSSYHLLSGSALVTTGGHVSLTTAGGWVHHGCRAALAVTDVRALVFREKDLRDATRLLPIGPT